MVNVWEANMFHEHLRQCTRTSQRIPFHEKCSLSQRRKLNHISLKTGAQGRRLCGRVNFRQPVGWFSACDSRAVTGVQWLPCGRRDGCGAGRSPRVRLAGAVSRQLAAPGGSSGGRGAGRSTGVQLAAEATEQEPGGTAVSPANQASTLLSVLWEIKGRGHLILNTVSRTAWTDRVEHLASVSVSVVCVSCLLHEYP